MTVWTEDLIDRLKTLHGEGRTGAQIAASLGRGLTRNAVIAKMHRLGLAALSKAQSPGQRKAILAARTGPRKPSPPASQPLPPEPEPPRDPIPLHQLQGEVCHFPFGDPRDEGFGFCGAPGHPWCAEHRAVVFTATKPRPVSAGPERKQTRWPSLGWGRGKGID